MGPMPTSERDVRVLLDAVKKERDTLADDCAVKTQMVVTLANTVHSLNAELNQQRAAANSKDEQLITNVTATSMLKQQISNLQSRSAAAERQSRELEEELAAAKSALADVAARADRSNALEEQVRALQNEKAELLTTMDGWKANVKEALKDNRKKEQQHVQTEIEQRRQITKLQEALDKAAFELETAKVREAHERPRTESAAQTDPMPETYRARTPPPATDAPALPHRSGTPDQMMHPEATPWMSPPAIKPAPAAEPPAPMIVTVHYGSDDGWTVDTKLLVKANMTVGDVINTACELVNSRYGRKLDCAAMCLKTHHARAARFVVLSEHREMHSFAYFQKLTKDSKPVVLQLEPVPPNATFASPTGRVSGRQRSTSRAANASEPRW